MRALDASTETLAGTIERVTFHTPETGFCVLRVRTPGRRGLITVVGKAGAVFPGESIQARGTWQVDARFGRQFRASELSISPPATLGGLEQYLASGALPGIGRAYAGRLIAAFGPQLIEVIEQSPEKLREVPGIGRRRAQELVVAWAEREQLRRLAQFLYDHQISASHAPRIHAIYGADAIAFIQQDPYRLMLDIPRIGFRTADALAYRLGVPRDALSRAQAGVRYALERLAGAGHCAGERTELTGLASRLLGINETVIIEAMGCELEAGRLIEEQLDSTACVFLTPIHRAENGVAGRLMRLLRGKCPWGRIDTARAISRMERENAIKLSASQREALALALTHKVTVITGGPGVGKTTLLKALIDIVRGSGIKVALCAPTGRAAKRLAQTTHLEASTIHRLLEFDPRQREFRRGRQYPLRAGLVVLDEASMVDVVLMNRLLQAIPPKAALVVVGDVDQLPAVGPGAVLSDIISSGAIPTARLTEVFRQAAGSQIIVNAHHIREGRMPLVSEEEREFQFVPVAGSQAILTELMEQATVHIARDLGLHPLEVQVLTPMNRGPLGARALNEILRHRLNPTGHPSIERFGLRLSVGDKVMQLVNDYEREVFNGEMGYVLRIDPKARVLEVDFEGRVVGYDFEAIESLSLAYASTIHRAQGCEYPAVVIPLSLAHARMLGRNLVYTAITRAKRRVVLIGESRALEQAVNNAGGMQRLTHLARRLRAALAASNRQRDG
jgi:exodeoxyribonuclease V alpha subunit